MAQVATDTSSPSVPGSDSVSDALGIKEVTSKMADNQREKIAAEDKVIGNLDNTINKSIPQIEELSKKAGVEAEKLKPWDADAESAKRRTDPIEAFGSFGSVFGILASAFTHAPMENALNASAAAMNAIKAGDKESYDRAQKGWEDNLKMTLDRHKIQHDAYQDAVSLLNVNMSAAQTKLQVLAARFGDKQVQTLLDAGMNKEVEDLLAARQRNSLALQEQMPKIVAENAKMSRLFALGYDPKAPTTEKSQEALVKFQKEQAELKRAGSAYGGGGASALTNDRVINRDADQHKQRQREEHPDWDEDKLNEDRDDYVRSRKIATAAPTSTRVDDLRGKIDQTDNILRLAHKNVTFLEKFKGGAGLMGKIMRGEEILGNIVGAGTQSERVQFRRNVLELQEIVPRILTDSNGRPLASAQAKVDGVVAGLAAGDTGPNTLRAYRELIADIKKRQQDYRGRIEGGHDPDKPSSGAGRRDTSTPEPAPDAKSQPWERDKLVDKKVGQ